MRRNHGSDAYDKLLYGGWDGLKSKLREFFEQAPPFVAEVLRKQQERLQQARERAEKKNASSGGGLRFDRSSGQWTPKKFATARNSTAPNNADAAARAKAQGADIIDLSKSGGAGAKSQGAEFIDLSKSGGVDENNRNRTPQVQGVAVASAPTAAAAAAADNATAGNDDNNDDGDDVVVGQTLSVHEVVNRRATEAEEKGETIELSPMK